MVTVSQEIDARSQTGLQQLCDERAALRAITELFVRTVPSDEILSAITVEACHLVGAASATLTRFGHDSHLVVLATYRGPAPAGARIDYPAGSFPDRVRRDGNVVRVDESRHEQDACLAAELGPGAAVSVPIFVSGQVWGVLTVTSGGPPLAFDAGQRLDQFIGLVTAVLVSVLKDVEFRALADEQAALRSVAELVARGAPAEDVLGTIARHACRLAQVDLGALVRYEPDGTSEIAALDGAAPGFVVGMRATAEGDGAVHRVWRTHRYARIDDHAHGLSSSVAVPIFISGGLWGALFVGRDQPLSADVHVHLARFADLASTLIAAVHTRRQLRQLADEQGAVRRVAELVARGAALPEVFTAVTDESSQLLGHLPAVLLRYDEVPVVVAAHGGERFSATEREYAAGVPITVEGRVWGSLSLTPAGTPPPAGSDDRLAPFAELAGAAIANAENREKLTASRARVVATADETRRRLQRDVHDGAQQRLVHTIIALKLARDALAAGGSAVDLVAEALRHAERANTDLRDMVRGILPEALTRGGLARGLESLVADLCVPVHVDAAVPRLPAGIETTTFFVVAEALANVVKHASASAATVSITVDGSHLDVRVVDDGVGGADPRNGSGLTGLLDRVEASNGSFVLTSPAGQGTTLAARLPLP